MEKILKVLKWKRNPRLSKINQGDTKRKLTIPVDLQKSLDQKETIIFEEIDYNGSEISDPFEEFHRDSYLSRSKSNKVLSKIEADRLTMASFTDLFKQNMRTIRAELKIKDNLMAEGSEDIEKILSENREPKDLPQSLKDHIEELLKDSEYTRPAPSVASDDNIFTQRSSSPTDAMSGVWNMLRENSKDKKFQISSPNFNAFQQEEVHWLDTPSITWETLNFSRAKCEKWLDEVNDPNI